MSSGTRSCKHLLLKLRCGGASTTREGMRGETALWWCLDDEGGDEWMRVGRRQDLSLKELFVIAYLRFATKL